MPSLDQVVIHLGMPKTGSTAIQHAYGGAREELATKRVLYPIAASLGDAHHPLAWAASLERTPRPGHPTLEALLANVEAEVDHNTRLLLLSSEALFHLPKVELARVVDWAREQSARVSLLAYVRTPVSYHEAWYRQKVKTSNYTLNLLEHIQTKPLVNTLRRMMIFEALQPDEVVARAYDRHQFPEGNVVRDFALFSNLPLPTARDDPAHNPNSSLDADLTEFKVELHRRGLEHTPEIQRAFVTWAAERGKTDRSLFARESWETFVEATQRDHATLLNRFSISDTFVDQPPSEFSNGEQDEEKFIGLWSEFTLRFPEIVKTASFK